MKLLVSALEPSSNKYLQEIIKHLNNTKLVGIADKSIIGSSIYPLDNFSVMGIASVLPKILFFKRAINEMALLSEDCDGVLLIDAPSFNLKIAKKIKDKYPNKPIFYYILPKIWAWKKNRLEFVEKYIDYQISILPFEYKFYSNALYFGNPLFDEYHNNTNIDFAKNEYIAFLPGSRKSEISSLLPIFRNMAKELNIKFTNKKALIVLPSIFSNEYINNTYGDLSDFKVVHDTKEALLISSFAFVCSGTATFEASLSGVPFVLCYTPKGIDWLIYFLFFKIFNKKGLGKIGYLGLANIISYFDNNQKIHKEVFPLVSVDALWSIYNNFDYKKHDKRVGIFMKIMNARDDKEVNSLEQVAKFILSKKL